MYDSTQSDKNQKSAIIELNLRLLYIKHQKSTHVLPLRKIPWSLQVLKYVTYSNSTISKSLEQIENPCTSSEKTPLVDTTAKIMLHRLTQLFRKVQNRLSDFISHNCPFLPNSQMFCQKIMVSGAISSVDWRFIVMMNAISGAGQKGGRDSYFCQFMWKLGTWLGL